MNPFLAFEAALPAIISESPSSILRRRETLTDTFDIPAVYIAGPYTVRIEPFVTGKGDVYDEKGSVSMLQFQLVGHSLPRMVEEGGASAALFMLNDVITDQDSNRYRVSAPPYWRGKVVWVTLELRAS